MKHYVFSAIFGLILFVPMMAQVPQGINYQAVVRDNTGNLQTNASLALRFTIEEGANTIYQEFHNTNSNAFGLVNLLIGKGTPLTGAFSAVTWTQGPYFLKVEMDAGNGFLNLGRTELVSVPFALHARSAASVENMVLADIEDVDASAPTANQVLKWNGTQWIPQIDRVDDADADPTNEIQSLSLSGNNLNLSNGGGSVALPTGTTYSAGNGITINGNVISNTGDVDSSNEIQSLSLSGNNLSLSNGGGSVNLPTAPTYSAGNGISLAGNVIINTGDTDGSDDITTGSTASGDLSGTYPNPNVTAIQGQNISNTTPTTGQVLKWNGNTWVADDDIEGAPPVWSLSGIDAHYDMGNVGIGAGAAPKVPFHVGNNQRVLFGEDTLGAGKKLMWLPDLGAFRVGGLFRGSPEIYWDRDSIGSYSLAAGANTRATGFGSTALGHVTKAKGTSSFACGTGSTAAGNSSFASGLSSFSNGMYTTTMGFRTSAHGTASTALGHKSAARRNYSLAAGYFSEALGLYSIAMGNEVQAQSHSSFAIGRYNVVRGNDSSWVNTDPIFEIGIGTSTTNRRNAMTVQKNGNVGIGITSPLGALHVNGQIRFASVEYMEDGGANEIAARGDIRPISDNLYDLGTASFRWDDVYATNGTVQTSDFREKENIEPIPYGLDEVMELNPVRFTWKNQPQQEPKLGLIAQDLLPLIQEVVKTHNLEPTEEDETVFIKKKLDRLGVYYADLIPVLIKATQEQQEIIVKQQALIQEIEERLKRLEN